MRRRDFILSAVAGFTATAVEFGPGFWKQAVAAAATAQTGAGPYGELGAPDANGLRLPPGFSSRLIARADQAVGDTTYVLPWFPDGSATFPTSDGGWILAVNSEVPLGAGGASAIRFGADGTIVDAYRILAGTSTNCAGGGTPWGTWLSCEEDERGRVFECDPTGAGSAVARPALGTFKHEAACVDTVEQRLYLTEDLGDGGFYRFTPEAYPSLESGLLEIATVDSNGAVTWTALPDPNPGLLATPTREQVPGSTQFARGEGIWYDAGHVYVATTSDETIHDYDVAAGSISTLYKQSETPGSPLQGVDNITVSRSGDLFVCEDSYDDDPDAMDVCMISREGIVCRFVKLTGDEHFGVEPSELTGVTFDPSGTRMYFGSQRAWNFGAIYEVTGPFRLDRPGSAQAIPEDPDARAVELGLIGLELPKRLPIRRLLRHGLVVRMTLDAPLEIGLKLMVEMPGQRGAHTVVLDAEKRKLGRGTHQVRMRVRGEGKRGRLRELSRPRGATLRVELVGESGRRELRRRLRLLPERDDPPRERAAPAASSAD